MLEACCPEEQLEAVEQEVHRQLQRTLREPVTAEEFDRALQLVGNGHRFNLEAPSCGRQCWHANVVGSPPRSLAPLDDLTRWDAAALSTGVMPLLQPQNAFTLIARPEEAA